MIVYILARGLCNLRENSVFKASKACVQLSTRPICMYLDKVRILNYLKETKLAKMFLLAPQLQPEN